MEIYQCEQYSEEWWAIRAGKLTASNAHTINVGGKGLETYVNNIMSEYYSMAKKNLYTNKDMERGNELESSAGMVYSFEKKIHVKKVGFVVYNDYIGCSPDLFAGENGLVEIKCPDDKAYFRMLKGEYPDDKYIWQCQCQMLICGKEWCDLVFYNPNFKTSLVTERIEPDKKKFEKLLNGFDIGIKLIKGIIVYFEKKEVANKLIESLQETKSIPHKDNWKKKHTAEINALDDVNRARVIKAGEAHAKKLKDDFKNKKNEKVNFAEQLFKTDKTLYDSIMKTLGIDELKTNEDYERFTVVHSEISNQEEKHQLGD